MHLYISEMRQLDNYITVKITNLCFVSVLKRKKARFRSAHFRKKTAIFHVLCSPLIKLLNKIRLSEMYQKK
jgi:hypothetical protein